MNPQVTIGLPVYNGENFLAQAIESVLAQSFTDFELLIADNGSTDATARICEAYADQDERVRVLRSATNRGAAWNYNRTVDAAQGRYFRWLAHDDMLAPNLLTKSVAILEERPEVVSVITWFIDIDDYGNELEVKRSSVKFDAVVPSERFRSMSELRPSYNCEEVFGLVRLSALRQTKMIANYVDSDRTLIAELGLHGPFYEIPEPLFLHRLHQSSSVVVNPSRQERAVWFDPAKKGKLMFPHWRQLGELFAAVQRSPLPYAEKLRCYSQMIYWSKRSRHRLGGDISWAIRKLA